MEGAPDADDLMLAENSNDTDDDAEAAAQVLSSVESRLAIQPTCMCMREMGSWTAHPKVKLIS